MRAHPGGLPMRLWPRSLKWRTILLTLLGLTAVIGTAGYVWWWPIRDFVSNQMAVWKDRDSEEPVTRGLACGEIRAGMSVDELIAAHPPQHVTHHGRFVDVTFNDNSNLTAMDGKLVRAQQGGCIRHAVYFDHFSPDESLEWYYSSSAYSRSTFNERKNAHGAVGGLMGCVETDLDLWQLARGEIVE